MKVPASDSQRWVKSRGCQAEARGASSPDFFCLINQSLDRELSFRPLGQLVSEPLKLPVAPLQELFTFPGAVCLLLLLLDAPSPLQLLPQLAPGPQPVQHVDQ